MKKFILAIAAFVMTATMIFAQDATPMAQATELYNNGASALSTKDYASALDYFNKAMEMGKTIGTEADELVANCKGVIPGVTLQIAKDMIQDGKFAEAETQLAAAEKIAAEYENSDVADEAASLYPEIWKRQASAALKLKDYATAASAYEKLYAADTTDAGTALKLGQFYKVLGKKDDAIKMFEAAAANGQEGAAKEQLEKMFLSEANAAFKSQKLADAITAAEKAISYKEDPTAYLIAGQASQKLNKNAQAIQYFEKYLELKPDASNAPAITFTVAALYQGANNKAKALEYYKKIENDAKFGTQAKQMIAALNK